MKLTRKCFGCKQDFRKTELIQYASVNAQTAQWYCQNCLKEKQDREKFSNKVCNIFGIKTPGPRIWTERKRLIDTYGYTDDLIIDCLDYIYNVEQKKKISETLALVNPSSMDKMLQWKRVQNNKAQSIINAITNTQITEYVVPIKEAQEKEIDLELLNADDFLE